MKTHPLTRNTLSAVLRHCFSGLLLGAVCVAAQAETLVVQGGEIYTQNPKQPWAQALVAEDGEIVYVGDQAGASAWIDDQATVVELEGEMVLPGLHDVHMHPLEARSSNFDCEMDYEGTINSWVKAIKACHRDKSGDGWLVGWGYEISALLEDGRDPRATLDKISTDRPITIMDVTSHSAWVNSKALEVLGIDRKTANPPGGFIGREANGEANGILLDTAGDLSFHRALEKKDKASRENDYLGLLDALAEIRQNGLTSIANARVYWKRGYLDAWYRAETEGELTARTVVGLWAYPEDINDDQQIKKLASMFDDENPMLRVSEIKLYDDGLSTNTTAAFLEPYLIDLEMGLESTTGLNYFKQDRMSRYITELEKVGFNFHIHVIGDRAVRESLNAIEAAQKNNGANKNRRHRLTHLPYIDSVDIKRFADLNVGADIQMAGDWVISEPPFEVELLGKHRVEHASPMRELIDAGARYTLSSDWDVSTLNPFVGMRNAMSRGKKSMTLEEVLNAYTVNAAYALGQEDTVGSLVVGKRADITIIDQNLFGKSPNAIAKTNVVMTIVDGEIVYDTP